MHTYNITPNELTDSFLAKKRRLDMTNHNFPPVETEGLEPESHKYHKTLIINYSFA
jgi:hypothetical protein